MNDLKALCVKYFGTDDLYEIFGLEKTAAQNEGFSFILKILNYN